MEYVEPTRVRIALPGGEGFMTTDPADVASLPKEILDAHPVVVSYGAGDVQIVYDARAGIRGMKGAVASVSSVDREALRVALSSPSGLSLDAEERAVVARLDGVLRPGAIDAEVRHAVLAGFVLVALRRALRIAADQ